MTSTLSREHIPALIDMFFQNLRDFDKENRLQSYENMLITARAIQSLGFRVVIFRRGYRELPIVCAFDERTVDSTLSDIERVAEVFDA